MKTLKMKLNMKIIALLTILVTIIATSMTKIKGKLQEQKGADGTTEKGGWIVISLIIAGVAITMLAKALLTVLVTVIATSMTKIKGKLQEQKGADGTTEKTGCIVISLAIAGIAVTMLVKKFFPEFFQLITDKMKEMFNLIQFN